MNIKELRLKLGLTIDQFAVKLGVAPYTVRRWESDKSQPSPLALEKLSKLNKARK